VASLQARKLVSRSDGIGLPENPMRARELKRLLAMTARMTPHQRTQLRDHLSNDLALNEALAL